VNLKRVVSRTVATIVLVGAGIAIMFVPGLLRNRRPRGPSVNPFAPLVDSGAVPRDRLPIDSARVMAALARVYDPELDFSIVDLGLVHESSVDSAGNVRVVMALTMPECPYGLTLARGAVQALKTVPGARRISLKLDPSIPWDPSRLYGKARERYDSLFRNDSAYNR